MSSEIFKRLNLRGFQVGKQIPLALLQSCTGSKGSVFRELLFRRSCHRDPPTGPQASAVSNRDNVPRRCV